MHDLLAQIAVMAEGFEIALQWIGIGFTIYVLRKLALV